MTYPVWPSTLDNPDSPLTNERGLPLIQGDAGDLGLPTSARIQTRTTLNGSGSLIVPAALFQTFFLFWRDTLNNGKSLFTAPWLSIMGYPEYVLRMPTYQMTTIGVIPQIDMTLELVPDVNLDPTDTFPDAWPVI